jgi:hypothetical protein
MSNHYFYSQHPNHQSQQGLSGVSLNHTVVSHVPHEAQINWKRPRNSLTESYSDDAMVICQPSLKRRRIMDGPENDTSTISHYEPSSLYDSNDVQWQESHSADVASLAEESIAQYPPYYPPEHASTIYHQPHHYHEQHQQLYQQAPPQGFPGKRPRILENPNQQQPTHLLAPSNVSPHATDYKLMNSVLGDLHMMRRRQRQGTGEGTITQPRAKEHQPIPQSSFQVGCTSSEQQLIDIQPLSKKKFVSLRVDSNLY